MAKYREAAEAGSDNALIRLAGVYYAGKYENYPQDYAAALSYYEQAAEKGNKTGMRSAGVMYHDGKGTAVDMEKARFYFEQAIHLADADACLYLGNMYYRGEIEPRNGEDADRLAFDLFEQGMEYGSKTAKYNLAICYISGRGCPVSASNKSKGRVYMNELAQVGYEPAVKWLEENPQ